MKRNRKFLELALVASCLTLITSCNKDDGNDPVAPIASETSDTTSTSVAVPTNLAVTNITQNNADLSWLSAATSFELQVGGSTYAITGTSYTVVGLQPGMPYVWAVCAKTPNASDVAIGPGFTTTGDSPLEQGARVTFGTYTWIAAYAVAYVYDGEETTPAIVVEAYAANSYTGHDGQIEYPFVTFYLDGANTEGVYMYKKWTGLWVYDAEYYRKGYFNASEWAGIELKEGEAPRIMGDYWLNIETDSYLDITAIDDGKVSGMLVGSMMETAVYAKSGGKNYGVEVPLRVEFKDLPIE
jgi:hypothetical protein